MNKKGFGGMGMGGGGRIMKILSFVLGLAVLAMGAIPILNSMGVIGFTISGIPGIIMNIILIVVGLLLIIDSVKIQSF